MHFSWLIIYEKISIRICLIIYLRHNSISMRMDIKLQIYKWKKEKNQSLYCIVMRTYIFKIIIKIKMLTITA